MEIIIYLGRLESNDCDLSDIYSCFIELKDEWKNDSELLAIVEERWAFVHTESMRFAYLLNPNTKAGLRMVGTDKMDTIEQLRDFVINKKQYNAELSELNLEINMFAQQMGAQSERLERI